MLSVVLTIKVLTIKLEVVMKNNSERFNGKIASISTMLLLVCLLGVTAAPVTAQWTAERDSFRYAVIVRNDTYQDPEWAEVVDSLVAKYSAAVFIYSTDIFDVQDAVGAFAPDYLAFVAEWDDATATFVSNAWLFGRALDDDPYGDEILSNVVDERFLPGIFSCCLNLDSIKESHSTDNLFKQFVRVDLSPVVLG